MKDERNVRKHRTAGGRWRPVALILAAVLMVLSVPFCTETAQAAVDLSLPCSLTINSSAGSAEDQEALAEANVVVDLYLIGDVRDDQYQYDTYHWSAISSFADNGLVLPESTDRNAWKDVTAQAAEMLLGSPSDGESQWNPSEKAGALINSLPTARKFEGNQLGEKIEGLPAGIYLIIPHGSNVAEYAALNPMAGVTEESSEDASSGSTEETAAADTSAAAAEAPIVTIAKASRRTYQFAPEMIALPTKDALADTGEINTANPSEWKYDAEVVLKPAQVGRGGDLRIIKDLVNYEEREKTTDGTTRQVIDNVSFIFEVSAYENEAAYSAADASAGRIYHNFVSIVFNEAVKKSALVTDLPVGSYVVVEEVYSGKNYVATIGTEKTTLIAADDVVAVEFENEYNGEHGGGGSVTNKFTYKKDQSKWGWEQMTDSSEDGTVIQSDTSTE